MYSRVKGKSGSTKPIKAIPEWAPYKDAEVEKLVIKYSKAGNTASETGIILRDTYGIHSVKALTGKSVSNILTENSIIPEFPEDLLSLFRKLSNVNLHLEKNRQDKTAKRGMQLTTAKINRLLKYYKRTGKVAADWKLDLKRLKMYSE